MTAPVDFLRRLAPQVDSDRTRAVASLPSRFAVERPLVAFNAQVPIAEHLDETAELSEIVSGRGQAVPASHGAVVRHLESVTLRDRGESRRHVPRVPEHVERAIASPVERMATAPAGSQHVSPPRVAEASSVSAAIGTPIARARIDSASRRAAPTPPRQPPVPAIRTPLSAETVAARQALRTQDPPVVHITIDRLDVRSAPREKPVAAPARTHASNPGVSLSDYLRADR